MRIFPLVFFLFNSFILQAQSVRDTLIDVTSDTWYNFTIGSYSGISVKLDDSAFSDQRLLIENSSPITLEQDPHSDVSAPLIFASDSKHMAFYSGSYSGRVTFYFLSIERVPEYQRISRSAATGDDCLPDIIPPSIWRSGLSAPDYTPSSTRTEHIIVHHAATSNHDPDPYQTVRSIYVQHTQINGWSDIGYNYLIGRDGSIFQGRDNKGLFAPDYTIGAHMCGKNAGTMGICLLGNYVNEAPTAAALKSLEQLIAWKCGKDNIDITGSSLHAIGPSGEPDRHLAHIAGHREGCRAGYTECPGDGLFAMLPKIRLQSETLLKDACVNIPIDPAIPDDSLLAKHLIFPNPSSDFIETNFAWDTMMIYDLSGKLFTVHTKQIGKIGVHHLQPGVYICQFIYSGRDRYLRLLVGSIAR